MRSFFRENKALKSIYAQLFVIVIAFVFMGLSSFFFATNIEHKHLIKDAENTLAFAESKIITSLLEPESFLLGYSETIRSMILDGNNEKIITDYMTSITNSLLEDTERMTGLSATHGHFFNFDGKYIIIRNAQEPENIMPQENPRYKKAVEANGQIVISEIHKDTVTGNNLLTISRLITDDQNNHLAVICMDMELSRIYNSAITINLTKSSYGILIDENLEILAHPYSYFIGRNLRDIESGLAILSDELFMGINIYERRIKNYMYDDSIVYFLKIKYDWFLGIVIPVREYYKSVNNMAVFLIVIGIILSAALCVMLYYIAHAKLKSDMRTQQKSNFLATMSHEIRTPLNAILGMTEIQMQNSSHPTATNEAFIKINNSGNLLLSIINDILDLSKIEAGKLELVPVKYEVSSLINDIIQLNYIRYESKPIDFIINVDENVPSILVGDELRIKQILNNLLSNAFKYTAKGEVTLSVNAECVGRGGGAVIVTLIFQVKDTGQGMTPEQLSKLFDEYTRFNMEANRTTEGAGLGMTITRNLVDLMYGKINVKSAVNEGTVVNVRLPQKTDGVGISGIIGKKGADNLRQFKQSSGVQYKKTQISHEYMPYGKVLIVDDVETNLYVAKGLMMPYCLKIDLATSGYEAIEKIKEGGHYDVVFMDHMMPKMDGIETAKLLRNSGYSKPIVALTANALAGQAEMFLKNGFDDFISKPIDIRKLNVVLNKLIRDKQSYEVIEAAHKEKERLDKIHGTGGKEPVQIDKQLAEVFARDAKKAVKTINDCMAGDLNSEADLQMYIINVHAMKSALANIGEKDLSAAALRLEQAGRDKDINVILAETHDFIIKMNLLIKDISLKNQDSEDIKDSDDAIAILNEKFIVIKEACAAYDKKTAKTILSELREKAWSSDTKELINLLAEHLLHSEFDEAAVLVDNFLRK